ncbi:MAG: hypothetical protein AAF488_11030 [Planctomycetota bacterium]
MRFQLGLLVVFVGIVAYGSCQAAFAGDSVVLIYDVRDLLTAPRDFPAPKLGLSGLEDEGESPFGDEDDEDRGAMFEAEELVELIETHIQPQRWELPGNSVQVHKGKLIIVADRELHAAVASNVDRWRSLGRPEVYAVHARCFPADADLAEALGFKKRSRRKSREVEREQVASALAEAEEFPRAATPLTVLENQRAHVSILNQQAYVADAKLDRSTGVVDPQIETLQEGVAFEIQVRPRTSKRVTLRWRVESSSRTASEFTEVHGTAVELPELVTESLKGRSILRLDRTLAIRGLSHEGRELVWLIDVEPVEKKKSKKKARRL